MADITWRGMTLVEQSVGNLQGVRRWLGRDGNVRASVEQWQSLGRCTAHVWYQDDAGRVTDRGVAELTDTPQISLDAAADDFVDIANNPGRANGKNQAIRNPERNAVSSIRTR